mgnify:FL=1
MLYSVLGTIFLTAGLVLVVYKIYDSMMKEFIKINNDKEEE